MTNKFRKWIKEQGGPAGAAKLLSVTPHAVRVWMRNEGTPKTATTIRLIRLSEGRLTFKDILSLQKKKA